VKTVFHRVLDYYNSILFQTTNRASVLDEAFKSRIHYKIYYPDLTLEQTLDIWELNINRVRRIEEQSESCSARSATAANIQRRESAAQGLLAMRTFSWIFGSSREKQIGSDMRMNDIDSQNGGHASLTIASNLAIELIIFCNILFVGTRFQGKRTLQRTLDST
jgi:hypothetical protein